MGEAAQKLKNITTKTLDCTISTKNIETGAQSSLSSKCADVNAEMFSCLGVSRPILNYVIFCHQEDSNWPLEEGSKVKEKFDEIFNSAKYKTCLKNIKDVRKAELDKAKLEKNNMEHYKSDKEYADKKNGELRRKKDDLRRLEDNIEKVSNEIEPLREALLQVQEEEKGYSDIQKKLAEAQTSYEHCRKERTTLEEQVTEIIPDEEEDDLITKRRDGIEKESKMKEKELKDLGVSLDEIESNIFRGEKQLQKNAAQIGKAVNERDQHLEDVTERGKMAETAISELDLVDHSDNVCHVLKKEDQKIRNQIKVVKAEFREKESKVEEEIDKLKTQRTSLEEGRRREQAEMVASKKEIAVLKRQLNELEGAADKLAKIKTDWEDCNKQLERERSNVDVKTLQEEIEQEKIMVGDLDKKALLLRDEIKILEENQVVLQKISHFSDDIETKEKKLNKLTNKRSNDFLQLFGVVPDSKKLKTMWKDGQDISDKKLKELESERKKIENDLNSKRVAKKDIKSLVEKKNSRKQLLESRIGEIISPEDDIEEEITSCQEGLELSRKELAVKEAGKFTYREMIDRIKAMKSSPACPTCNRAFHDKSEASELVEELEEMISSIPNKVKSLEVKVKKLDFKLQEFQRLRPEVHELKSIKVELEESNKKLEKLDADIKQLQERLDEGEEDLNMTELNVSLFRQIGEDVQAIDSF